MGLIQEFQRADAERRKEVAVLAREVAASLGDFRKFVRHLHKLSGDRRSDVATMRADTDAFVGHLHTKVAADRRADVAAIHSEVWGGAARAKRAAPPHRAAAPPPAPAVGEAGVTLRDVIFTYLAEHPDGAKLTQLEQDLNMARIKLAQVMRQLMEENKVEKRDLLYFAI
jgi:hypothetical protein